MAIAPSPFPRPSCTVWSRTREEKPTGRAASRPYSEETHVRGIAQTEANVGRGLQAIDGAHALDPEDLGEQQAEGLSGIQKKERLG